MKALGSVWNIIRTPITSSSSLESNQSESSESSVLQETVNTVDTFFSQSFGIAAPEEPKKEEAKQETVEKDTSSIQAPEQEAPSQEEVEIPLEQISQEKEPRPSSSSSSQVSPERSSEREERVERPSVRLGSTSYEIKKSIHVDLSDKSSSFNKDAKITKILLEKFFDPDSSRRTDLIIDRKTGKLQRIEHIESNLYTIQEAIQKGLHVPTLLPENEGDENIFFNKDQLALLKTFGSKVEIGFHKSASQEFKDRINKKNITGTKAHELTPEQEEKLKDFLNARIEAFFAKILEKKGLKKAVYEKPLEVIVGILQVGKVRKRDLPDNKELLLEINTTNDILIDDLEEKATENAAKLRKLRYTTEPLRSLRSVRKGESFEEFYLQLGTEVRTSRVLH